MTRRILRFAIVCLVLYWALLCTMTHLPGQDLPHVEVNDKLEHFTAFVVLGFLLNTVLGQLIPRHRDWLTLAFVLVYGAADETLQPLTGRTCDFMDWLADGGGAAAGVVLCNLARLVWTGLRGRGPSAGSESEELVAAEPLEHR